MLLGAHKLHVYFKKHAHLSVSTHIFFRPAMSVILLQVNDFNFTIPSLAKVSVINVRLKFRFMWILLLWVVEKTNYLARNMLLSANARVNVGIGRLDVLSD